MYGTDPPRASRHRRQRGWPPAACYVARAVTRPARTAKLGACAALAAALTAVGGCGDDRQADDASGTYDVVVESVAFAARQRLAERNSFVLRVRNAGERTIPNLVVTLRGFSDGAGADRSAPRRNVWLIDEPPAGTTTSIDDTWAAGALAAGATRTLRWVVTPVVAGTHALSYAIAPGLSGDGRVQRAGRDDGAGDTLTVRVADRPAKARVDPRSGRVLRE